MSKSPADLLAEKKPWRRVARNVIAIRRVAWICSLRDIRRKKKLAMADVARAIGLATSTLHTLEHGGDPMLTTAKKLADFYGVSVWKLWPKLAEGEKS
jgi:DNA-binding XRE family transcriptional regulator